MPSRSRSIIYCQHANLLETNELQSQRQQLDMFLKIYIIIYMYKILIHIYSIYLMYLMHFSKQLIM